MKLSFSFFLFIILIFVSCNDSLDTKKIKCFEDSNCPNNYNCILDENNQSYCIEDACKNIDCGDNGSCKIENRAVICNCSSGYKHDILLLQCVDINECQLETDNCDENAICVNRVGSFSCINSGSCTEIIDNCGSGFNCVNNNGVYSCIDIDECQLETDNCHENATCTNTDGSFSCKCNIGYYGDGVSCISGAFITAWKTDNEGVSSSTQITIPTNPNYTYSYDVDCNSDGIFEATNVTGDYTCSYSAAGVYQVAIVGGFPAIYFNGEGDKLKILSIDNWGLIHWQTMIFAFSGCENLTLTAIDSPDLSTLTNMSGMFYGATSFNGDISSWNVLKVKNMSQMFANAISFNRDISSWDVSKVIDMSYMFASASSFNQPLNSWDVSSVTNMSGMFSNAISFNQPLNSWDVSKVTTMSQMFFYATAFKQSLNSWNVSNVTDIDAIFYNATSFNADLSDWDVSKVTNMSDIFTYATSFNGDISNWNVSNVTNMKNMFYGAESFNQDLSSWDVDQVTTCDEFAYNTPSWTLPKPNFTSCNPE